MCLVEGFEGDVLLIGGLDNDGHPVRFGFRMNIDTEKGEIGLVTNAFIQGASRAYHACLQTTYYEFSELDHHLIPKKRLFIAGGITQPFRQGQRITWTSTDFMSNDGHNYGWKKHSKMIHAKSAFGLVALKTGHKRDTNILAIGGLKVHVTPTEVNTLLSLQMVSSSIKYFLITLKDEIVDVDTVEQFDGKSWYYINPDFAKLPKQMSRFVAIAVPSNITVHCDCVPDQTSDLCYYITG